MRSGCTYGMKARATRIAFSILRQAVCSRVFGSGPARLVTDRTGDIGNRFRPRAITQLVLKRVEIPLGLRSSRNTLSFTRLSRLNGSVSLP
jgi:hypothetical protein